MNRPVSPAPLVFGLALLLPLVFYPWLLAPYLIVKDAVLVLAAAAAAGFVALSYVGGGGLPLPRRSLHVPVLLFAAVVLAGGALRAADAGMRDTLRIVACAALFLICAGPGVPRRALDRALGAACVAGAAAALYGILQFCGIDIFADAPGAVHEGEITSTFGNPNLLAGYLAGVLPLAVCLAVAGASWRARVLFAACATLSAVCLALTASRAGWLAALTGLLSVAVWLLQSRRPRRGLLVILGAVWVTGVVVAALILSSGPAGPAQRLVERVRRKAATANAQRKLLHWRVAADMAAARPITGHGVGAYKLLYLDYQTAILEGDGGGAWLPYWSNAKRVHNEYLQLAAETGLLGAGLALWSLIALGRLARRQDPSPVTAGAAACCTAVLLVGVFSFPFHVSATAFLFVLCAARLVPRAEGEPKASRTRPALLRVLAAAAVGVCLLWLALFQGRRLAASYYSRKAYTFSRGDPDQRSWGDASRYLVKAVVLDPGNGEARAQLGRALLNAGYEGAVHELEMARRTFVNPDSVANLARAYADMGDWWTAVRWYRRACRVDPKSVDYRRNLATACLVAGYNTEAALHFRAARDMLEDHLLGDHDLPLAERRSLRTWIADAHVGAGIARLQNGRDAEAEAEFRRALEVLPNDPRAGLNLGLVYLDRNEPAKAIALYTRLLEWRGGVPSLKFNLAQAYVAADQKQKAIPLLEEIVNSPGQPALADAARKWLETLKKPEP